MTGMGSPPSPWRDLDGNDLLQLARHDGIDVAEIVAETAALDAATIDALDAVLSADLTDPDGRTVYDLAAGEVPRERTAITAEHDGLAATYNDHAADDSAHHSRYADSEARAAVDGSSVTVEEATVAAVAENAENADQLGGNSPSAYETPNSTDMASNIGGYELVGTNSGTLGPYEEASTTVYFDGRPADGFSLTTPDNGGNDTGWTIDLASESFSDLSHLEGNFELSYVDSAEITVNNSGEWDREWSFELEVHVVENAPHSHPI